MIGMILTVLISLFFVKVIGWPVTYSMLLSITIGFWMIAALEFSVVRSYFRVNSGKYKEVLEYFRKYWQLVITNFLYILGLYVHNFVFWTTDLRMVVAKSFVSVSTYDMATCLAMFTNISASVIFISRVEMHFHERYKVYSEAVTGGRGEDIRVAKKRMFRPLVGRTGESCQSAVYYFTDHFSSGNDSSSEIRIWRFNTAYLSMPCSWLFHIIFDVCRDYLFVLFQ